MNLRVLNSKEKKRLLNEIKEQYGIKELKMEYIFLKNNKGRVFILSEDYRKIETEKLRISNLGLYFANIQEGLRLTIEGSQLIGPKARKNVLEIKDAKEWMKGNDIETEEEFKGYVIIRKENNYYGAGKYKNHKIINFIPKERRVINGSIKRSELKVT